MNSFENKKALRFIITLQTGSFGSSKGNTITLEGYRAAVNIDHAGGAMFGSLQAQIWGVSQSDMNSVTTLQLKPRTVNNTTVQVFAIDGSQETLVFQGNVVNAWGVYDNMPDVYLMIQAQAAYFNLLQVIPPTSIKGSVDVATLMSQLAGKMGYTFENNGVNVQLSNPYLSNSAMRQAMDLAEAAGINMYIEGNVLAITPRDTPRSMSKIPQISATSGLIGYPTFDGYGVSFETLFNPAIKFGGSVSLVTSVKAISDVSTTWIVGSMSHALESEKPGGRWVSRVRGLVMAISS
jgi:hypothetical protein